MMTPCPQCNRLVDSAKPRCLYCGAPIRIVAQPPSAAPANQADILSSDGRDTGSVNLHDLPAELRGRVMETLRNRKTGSAAVEAVEKIQKCKHSPDDILAAIRQLNDSFAADRLDYDEYRALVVDTLMQYVETLPEKDRMSFVFQELEKSDFAAFIDESIFKTLSARVLAAAIQTLNNSDLTGKIKRKRFRLFRR